MNDNFARVGFLLVVLLLIYLNASGRLPNALTVLRGGTVPTRASFTPPIQTTLPPVTTPGGGIDKTVPPSWNQTIPYDPFGSGNSLTPSTLTALLTSTYGLF